MSFSPWMSVTLAFFSVIGGFSLPDEFPFPSCASAVNEFTSEIERSKNRERMRSFSEVPSTAGLADFLTSDRSSVVHGSTAKWVAPTGLNVFTVLYDARYGRIA